MKNKIQEILDTPVGAYKCHKCSKVLRPDANFCSSCGLKVVKATPTTGTVTAAKGPGSGGLQTTSDPRGFLDELAESVYSKVVRKIYHS